MALVDTHCHLNHPPLCHDTDGVLDRATAVGVTRVVVPAYDTHCWAELARLAARPGVAMTLGLHPWLAHDLPGQVAGLDGPLFDGGDTVTAATLDPATALDRFIHHLAARAAALRPVGIGEIGLDTKISASGLPQQLPLLERQLALAADLDLPVILHCRGAFEEMLAALQRHGGRLRGVRACVFARAGGGGAVRGGRDACRPRRRGDARPGPAGAPRRADRAAGSPAAGDRRTVDRAGGRRARADRAAPRIRRGVRGGDSAGSDDDGDGGRDHR